MSKNFEIEPLFEETLDFTELSKLAGGTGDGSGSNSGQLWGCKKGASGNCHLFEK